MFFLLCVISVMYVFCVHILIYRISLTHLQPPRPERLFLSHPISNTLILGRSFFLLNDRKAVNQQIQADKFVNDFCCFVDP